MTDDGLSRRAFVESAAAAALLTGAVALHAAPKPTKTDDEEKPRNTRQVTAGVIGTGLWGKELLKGLAKVEDDLPDGKKSATVKLAAICDIEKRPLTQAQELAPTAKALADYKAILDDKAIEAVVVATPSHLHKQVVLDALAAGKHVFCEAPLATTPADLKAICAAAKAAKTVFQPGLQRQTQPMTTHIMKFVKSGALKQVLQVTAQWRRKDQMYRAAADEERIRVRNWRNYRDTSIGLVGEFGIHEINTINVVAMKLPTAVRGIGRIARWTEDGRDLYDTAQCEFEYADGLRFTLDVSSAASYGGAYETIYGADGTILFKEDRAWMFRESGAPNQGWEVYARKDKIFDETGIALVANSSQILAQGQDPSKAPPDAKGSMYYCLEAFLDAIRGNGERTCTVADGYLNTMLAMKAHEAVLKGVRIAIDPKELKLG